MAFPRRGISLSPLIALMHSSWASNELALIEEPYNGYSSGSYPTPPHQTIVIAERAGENIYHQELFHQAITEPSPFIPHGGYIQKPGREEGYSHGVFLSRFFVSFLQGPLIATTLSADQAICLNRKLEGRGVYLRSVVSLLDSQTLPPPPAFNCLVVSSLSAHELMLCSYGWCTWSEFRWPHGKGGGFSAISLTFIVCIEKVAN